MTEDEIEAECDRIMKMSPAEIDAHIRLQGDDPDMVAKRFDIIVRNAVAIVRLRNAIKSALASHAAGFMLSGDVVEEMRRAVAETNL